MFLRLGNFSKTLKTASRRFIDYRRGNVAVMFALSAVPFAIAVGSAVDYERAVNAKANIMQALDSAAVYAATMPSTATDTQRAAAVLQFVNSNGTSQGATSDAVISNVAVTNYTDHVAVTGTISVKTSFTSLIGLSSIDIPAAVEVRKGGINLEVSLVLDNTGSMAGTPVASLITAANNFVDIVVQTTQSPFYSKVAIIPYNNGVNVGSTMANLVRGTPTSGTATTPGSVNYTFPTGAYTYDKHGTAIAVTDTLPISNCVTERTGTTAQTYTDVNPYNNGVLVNPVGRQYGPTGNNCIVVPMVPLTADKTALHNTINSMTAGGSTAGQVGIGWGWYALSPTFGVWSGTSVPAGYDKLTTTDSTTKVRKVMVLMTDAEYNSGYCNGVITGNPTVSGSGSSSDHIYCAATNGDSYVQATAMCQAAKQAGIEVYVIEFQLDSTIQLRVDLINNCATDSGHVLNASDNTQLNNVFQSLANNLMSLYVSK